MKNLRLCVPVLGFIALIVLFLKLPEVIKAFGVFGCQTCVSGDPFLILIGAGYFAAIVAISLLFPAFPHPYLARGGLTWAVLLAFALTYILLPSWCLACLICHACNILIWAIWMVPYKLKQPRTSSFRERLCIALFAPLSVIALFSSLNLTFMAYEIKKTRSLSIKGLHPGDALPFFSAQTNEGKTLANSDTERLTSAVINFISPSCPYCKEQMPILKEIVEQLPKDTYQFINVSPRVPSEWTANSSPFVWVEDDQGQMRELFKVSGYPTLYVVGADGKIAQIIPGVPEHLQVDLISSLGVKPKD